MFNCLYEYLLKKTNGENQKVPFHSHTCFELVYYNSGEGVTLINGTRYPYRANDMVIIEPGSQHNDLTKERSDVICIGFSYDNVEFPLKSGVYRDKNKRVQKLINSLVSEMREKQVYYDFFCNTLIAQILVEIGRLVLHASPDAVKDDCVNQVLKYIDQYFLTEISIEQLSQMANYSYHRFRHIFKEKMGVSPKRYILNKRLTHVKKLLQETDKSITELAYSCGFGSTSRLISLFHKTYGMSPLKYRSAHKSNSPDAITSHADEKELDSIPETDNVD
ncbi:MAG: AraC family transcriptional regulator [Clostridia bacterium]|nr:AraC family transcriptional regulator [Clostridia bacterium]